MWSKPPLMLLFSLLVPVSAAAQDSPPTSLPIQPAALLHVSTEGLQAIGDSIGGVVPQEIVATGLSGEFVCDEETGVPLTYEADDIVLRISADEVEIRPLTNRLEVALGLTIWSDPADINLTGTCVVDLNEACTLSLPPTPIDALIGVQVVLQNGELLTNVTDVDISYGNFGNPVGTGCLLGDALETMQGLGVDLIGSILDDVIGDQLGELEGQLEEILGGLATALTFDTSIDALGTQLDISFGASSLDINPQGLELGFEAQFSTPQWGDCVQPSGPYQQQAHDPPAMTGLIPSTTVPYHMGVVVNEDLLNQLIYVGWQGGLLCLSLAELAPIDIDTNYLALIDQELVEELWPETQLLDLLISADEPPVADLSGGPSVVADLRLDVYGEELERKTRFWGHGLFADVGVGLELEDGTLLIDVGFDLETDLGVTVSYNEYLPQALPEGFAGLIPSLASQFVDLETLVPSFPIPAVFGLTLADLEMRVVGDNEDYLGLYAWVNPDDAIPIPIGPIELAGIGCGDTSDGGGITVPGCEDGCADSGLEGCDSSGDGGCGGCGEEDGGCGDSGCTAGGYRFGARSLFSILVPMLIWTRRRR